MSWNGWWIPLSAVVFCIGSPALSQTTDPSRVTPKSFAPAQTSRIGGVTLGQTEPGIVPAGAETYSVLVSSLIVEGGLPQLASGTSEVEARLIGRKVSVKELYATAAQIEAAYARAGFVLTRVIVPPQTLVNGGTFRLIVVDGFIEAIDVAAVPEHVRAIVAARVAPLVGVHGLTSTEIERRLMLAGEVPGVRLASAITRGTAVGGARLVLEADWRPVSASIGVDTKIGKLYRGVEFPATASLNSVLGLGETIYGTAITGPDVNTLFSGAPIRRVAAIGLILPIGTDGWTLNPEYARSVTNPILPAGAARITGVFDHFALRSLYPLIKTRKDELTITGSFELTDEQQLASDFGTLTSLDRLRVATVGLEGSRSLDWSGTLHASLLATQGTDWFGARTAAAALASGIPLSRQGSRPDYSKIEASLRYDQALPGDFIGTAIVHAQQALSGPLPGAAQFALQGDDALSAFDAGALSVDSGVSLRTELGRAFAIGSLGAAATATPYAFGAVGLGTVDAPTGVETSRLSATSYGLGLRFRLGEAKTGVTSLAAIEVGQSHATLPGNAATRVTASWILRY